MELIPDESIEECEDDPFSSSETAPELKPLPSTLKYAFLDHQHAEPVIIMAVYDPHCHEGTTPRHRRSRHTHARLAPTTSKDEGC